MRKKFAFLIAALLVILSLMSCSGASGQTVGNVDISGTEAEDELSAEGQEEKADGAGEDGKSGGKESENDGTVQNADGQKNEDRNAAVSAEKNMPQAQLQGAAAGADIHGAGNPDQSGAATAQQGTDADKNTGAGADTSMSDEEYKVFDGALFIGDSRTEGLSLYSGIKNADFFCAKALSIDKVVKGDQVSVGGVKMSVYDILKSKEYTKVYISMGLNELGWTYIDKYINEYKTLIEAVRENQPEATIFVQALLPVTKEKSDKGGTVNNAQIYWYNTNLAQMAADTGTVYINADENLIEEDGTLLADATTDGVHLKSEYCKVWAKKLAELTDI